LAQGILAHGIFAQALFVSCQSQLASTTMRSTMLFFSCFACACDSERALMHRKDVSPPESLARVDAQSSSENRPFKSLAALLLASRSASPFQALGAAGTLARASRYTAAKMEDPLWSRRESIIAGGLAVANALSALPAKAIPIDPIGVYSNLPETRGPVVSKNGQPNFGSLLLRDCFDGVLPPEGLVEWYEEHLTDDFVAELAGGEIKLDKSAFKAMAKDMLKSFPDLVYTSLSSFKFADSPTVVTWTGVIKGTHSGAPFSPGAGVPPVEAKNPPVACQTDPEQFTAYFASDTTPRLTKVKRLKVEAKGDKSGPRGLYLKAGGDPSKLPPL